MIFIRKRILLPLLILTSVIIPVKAEGRYACSLAFIGPADALYSWWGHVALIIEDKSAGSSRYYDYGNFSFSQDAFVRNFIMGRLYFLKMASNPGPQLRYSALLNRDVTIYELNLSDQRAAELSIFLENEILPENRIYLYDHFYDNCSTRIRDIIDTAVNGELKKASEGPDLSLRKQLRRYTYNSLFMDWLLNFAINGEYDKPATLWEGMYLPGRLEQGIANLIITDDKGNRIPLVKTRTVLNRAEGRTVLPDLPPPMWPRGLVAGVFLTAVASLLKKKSWNSRLSKRLYALYSFLLSFTFAIPGTLLFFMAFFTDHSFTYWNRNLLYINPFLFITAALSLRLLIRKTDGENSVEKCWFVTLLGAAAALVISLIPASSQDCLMSILMLAPAAFVQSRLMKINSVTKIGEKRTGE